MKLYHYFSIALATLLLSCGDSSVNSDSDTSSGTQSSSLEANSSKHPLSSEEQLSFGSSSSSKALIGKSSSGTEIISTDFDWKACTSSGKCGTFIDARDSRTYKWVTIGKQVWMGENLIGTYTWAEAMTYPSECDLSFCKGATQNQHQGACPTGWHLPSANDFSELVQFVRADSSISFQSHLKATSWDNSKDSYGFSATPTEIDSLILWGASEWEYNLAQGFTLKTGFDTPTDANEWKGEKHNIRCLKNSTSSSSSSLSSSSSAPIACQALQSNQFCDTRDGKAYTFKKYGIHYWMTQSLNWEGAGVCAFTPASECVLRGRHYSPKLMELNSFSHESQQGACPTGWRIPDFEEWKRLAITVKGAQNLKGVDKASNSEWNSSFNNQDSAGFHLLPAGTVSSFGFSNTLADSLSSAEMLTTSSQKTSYFTTFLVSTRAGNAGTETWYGIESSLYEANGASVRCVKTDWSVAP